MNNKSHLTAITRKKLSAPMKYLSEKGLLNGKVLDFGCGKGFDAETLGLEKYDLFYFPFHLRLENYDTITCNYVFNVVTPEKEKELLIEILSHLRPGGTAYISVRRDKFKEGWNSKGTYQRTVELDYPILKEAKGKFVIYQVSK